jgi:hypothetical protein
MNGLQSVRCPPFRRHKPDIARLPGLTVTLHEDLCCSTNASTLLTFSRACRKRHLGDMGFEKAAS